jgi:ABC-2 type transport system permease protein
MADLFRSFVRASAFWVKEVPEVLRQPRLVLTLVLGPFLLMLLVGFGYRHEARVLRALFVVPEGSEAEPMVEAYASNLSGSLDFRGTTSDEGEALSSLRRGQVDVVVVIPPEAEEGFRGRSQVVLQVYHNEVDPFQASYVSHVVNVTWPR